MSRRWCWYRVIDKDSYAKIQKFDLIRVGLMLMPDTNDPDQKIMVGAPPVPGSVAEKAGIVKGDYIMKVNGVETKGRSAFAIIGQIGDNPEAKMVEMTVLTEGGESGHRRRKCLRGQCAISAGPSSRGSQTVLGRD